MNEKEIYNTKKEYLTEEEYIIHSKLQTEKELLNLGETIAFNKFNKELELKQYEEKCSELFKILEKYEDKEENLHKFFKKKSENEFNEILKMMKLIYEYQKKENNLLLVENTKLKESLEDIQEELDEENKNNIIYEEKLDLFEEREICKIKLIKNKYENQVLKLNKICDIFIYILGYIFTNVILYLIFNVKIDIIPFILIVIILLFIGESKLLYKYKPIYINILIELVIFIYVYKYLVKMMKKYKNNYLKKND